MEKVYLKEANMEDVQKEYEFITQLPEDENGFTPEMREIYGSYKDHHDQPSFSKESAEQREAEGLH